ncbi:hypothetical protein Cgig2_017742 [Carnegiea gigantea]|uniref:Uncharacterized protein n=1 Tax=Carnegiea gigantea TaxID=171969 RepID=A0A9Q1GSL9_9CARY|nr:hypothetical protein Cgig2_017742 [Carnegiea gigantea]
MIRLPIHFGDKLKSKNLEVDFLVVDVPTTDNVILGVQPFTRAACLVPCAFTLAQERDKLHLLGVTTFILDSLTLAYIAEVGLKIAVLLKLLGQLTSPSSLRHSAAAFTHWVNALASATSSSMTFGGSEVPGVTKSQDLIKSWTSENLAAESALMNLFLEARVRSPINRLSDCRGADCFGSRFPRMRRGGCHGLIRTALSPLPLADRKIQESQEGWTNKVINCTFLACWMTRRYFSPSHRRSAVAATCSEMASPVSKTVNLRLACSI